MRGFTTRLHWTDAPYHWHVNDGEEVFAVLDGRVEMCVKENGHERSVVLETGDVFFASAGTEHVDRRSGMRACSSSKPRAVSDRRMLAGDMRSERTLAPSERDGHLLRPARSRIRSRL